LNHIDKSILIEFLSISLGISGGPGKEYQECEMVKKEFCEDVPRNEDVEGDVETCVNTPKEVSEEDHTILQFLNFLQVCEDGQQRAQKQICERIKTQAAKPK
jgi:hypothetical protein